MSAVTHSPDFEAAWLKVAHVDGWLTEGQARRLFTAAGRTIAGDTIVEIGSFRGSSIVVLASAAPAGVAIVAIEPHAGNDRGPQEIDGFATEASVDLEVFRSNLTKAGVADRVRHVRKFSDQAHADVSGDIALLYVDGAHRYRAARADIRDWGRRVAPGGTLLIHDSLSSIGVTLAIVRELLFGRFRYVGRSRSLAEYRADLGDGPGSRIANAGRQALQLPWFAKVVLIKVLLTIGVGKVWQKVTGRETPWPF